MKKKYHIKKQKVFIQLTDGSVFKLGVFSKNPVFKLSVDFKSHLLWKINVEHVIQTNYRTIFLKRFNYLSR